MKTFSRRLISVAAALLIAFSLASCNSNSNSKTIDNSVSISDKQSMDNQNKVVHDLPAKDATIMLEGIEEKVHYNGVVIEASGEKLSAYGVYYDADMYKVFEKSDKIVLAPKGYTAEDMKNPMMSLTIAQSAKSIEDVAESEANRLKKEGAKVIRTDHAEESKIIITASWNEDPEDLDGSRMEDVIIYPNNNGGSIIARVRYIADTGVIEGGYSRMVEMANEVIVFED